MPEMCENKVSIHQEAELDNVSSRKKQGRQEILTLGHQLMGSVNKAILLTKTPVHLCSQDFLLAGLTWMAVSWLNLSWQLWDVHTIPHSGLWDYAKQSNFLALTNQKICMATKIGVPSFCFTTKKKKVTVLCLTSLTKVFFWSRVVLERQPVGGISVPSLDLYAIECAPSMLFDSF